MEVDAIFPNCPRYIHKMAMVAGSPFAPCEGHTPPVPEWKARPVFREVLPPAIPPCRPKSEDRADDAHSERVAFARHVVYTVLSDFEWSQALLLSGAVGYNTLLSPEPSEDLG